MNYPKSFFNSCDFELLCFAVLHQGTSCTYIEAGVRMVSFRMLLSKTRCQLECDKLLYRGKGGQNGNFFHYVLFESSLLPFEDLVAGIVEVL